MRTVFFGSPPFATPLFDALAKSPHRPLALITLPERPRGRGRQVLPSALATLAAQLDIAAHAFEDPHEASALEILRGFRPDVLLVASYGRLLKRALLELAPHGAWNVHASLLPRWRGASPIQAAILHGDNETGVCVQRMVAALDAGDVITQRRCPIGPTQTAGELTQQLGVLGAQALLEALDMAEQGALALRAQDPAGVTIARKIDKAAGHVRFDQPAELLARIVRAYNPWPLVRCVEPRGRELAILAARPVALEHDDPFGRLRAERDRLLVCVPGGALELLVVQLAGKNPLAGVEYARGARFGPQASLRPL